MLINNQLRVTFVVDPFDAKCCIFVPIYNNTVKFTNNLFYRKPRLEAKYYKYKHLTTPNIANIIEYKKK